MIRRMSSISANSVLIWFSLQVLRGGLEVVRFLFALPSDPRRRVRGAHLRLCRKPSCAERAWYRPTATRAARVFRQNKVRADIHIEWPWLGGAFSFRRFFPAGCAPSRK